MVFKYSPRMYSLNHVRRCSCLAIDMEDKQTELETKSR